jgi:hypothetical protein
MRIFRELAKKIGRVLLSTLEDLFLIPKIGRSREIIFLAILSKVIIIFLVANLILILHETMMLVFLDRRVLTFKLRFGIINGF